MSRHASEQVPGVELQRFGHYIGGRSVPPAGGAYFLSENPYTGKPWAEVARGNAADVEAAVRAAGVGLKKWSGLKARERAALMQRLADLVVENARSLAATEVRDNGKLFGEMHPQMHYIAGWLRYFAGLCDKIEGRVVATDKDDIFNFTQYEPLGIIGMITPWNSPLLLLAWKLAPALAAGNVAIVKPSEFTSTSTLEFAELFSRAGFPDGVFNVVTGLGPEAGAALVEHPVLAKIAFTGSDAAGQKIYESAARTFKHVSLELGGKSPNIIFDDADLEQAALGAVSGIFAAAGQTCIAGSRLLVQRSVHDEVVRRLIEIAGNVRIGDPMDAATNIGPIATRPQFEKILHYIEIAKAEGAMCVLGGAPYDAEGGGGQFVLPTIFTHVSNTMRIAQEEVFGPVLAVIPFDTEEDAYEIANQSAYGLGAGVWTKDIARALRAAARIKAGTVWVNTYRALSYTSPFGGYKRSGLGREGGLEAIKEYLQTKSVWISTAPYTDNPFVMR